MATGDDADTQRLARPSVGCWLGPCHASKGHGGGGGGGYTDPREERGSQTSTQLPNKQGKQAEASISFVYLSSSSSFPSSSALPNPLMRLLRSEEEGERKEEEKKIGQE